MKRNLSLLSVMVLFVFAVAASAFASSQQFVAAPSFPAGPGPRLIAQGDLNKDGIEDLVVTGSGSITVMLGRKDGTFGPTRTASIQDQPVALALGDLDGDGNLDLAVGLFDSENGGPGVKVFRGNGNGTFQPGVLVDHDSCNVGVAIADLNNDHHNDLLVLDGCASGGTGTLQVLLNTGQGRLSSPVSYSLIDLPSALTVGDLNNDGNMDVAVVSTAGAAVSVFLAKSDGTLNNFVNYAAGDVPISIAAGDVNRDGKMDLVVGSSRSGVEGIEVLLNKGGGTFGQPVFTPFPGSRSVQLADFNGDGKLDVTAIGAGTYEKYVAVGFGNGDGTFRQQPWVYGLTSPGAIALGDFNRDKKADLAVTEGLTDSVAVLYGKGDGTFFAATSYVGNYYASILAVDDFNDDGVQDMVVPGLGLLQTFLGNGNGTFQSPPKTSTYEYWTTSIASADFNGDGRKDLVLGYAPNGGSGKIEIYPGNGDGTFLQTDSYPLTYGVYSVAAADFNGDKKPDIVAAGTIAVFVFLNNGDGTFAPPLEFAPGYSPRYVTTADLNKDGIPDLVIGANSSNIGAVLLGNGDGTFQNPILLPGNAGLVSATNGDFNGDGKPDLAGLSGNGITLYFGHGDGTFDLGPTYKTSGFNITSADFNADGNLDLAVVGASAVSLFSGNGKGQFLNTSSYQLGEYLYPLAVADFNGDHRPDLATVDSDSDTVTVLLNTGAK